MTEIKERVSPAPDKDEMTWFAPLEGVAAPAAGRAAPLMVPIRSLGANHRERIARHLLALDQNDRYLRFGFVANDAQIERYADSLDFDHDEIFGIYNRRLQLIAMAHLAFAPDS